jgi:hypothetical protein
MVLHLAGRGGVSVSPELRRRIQAKIAKMQHLFPKLIEARVVLATERYRHLAEVTLRAKRACYSPSRVVDLAFAEGIRRGHLPHKGGDLGIDARTVSGRPPRVGPSTRGSLGAPS